MSQTSAERNRSLRYTVLIPLETAGYLEALYNVCEARSLVGDASPAADHHVADGRRTGARNVETSAARHRLDHLEVRPARVRHVAVREHLPQQHAERPAERMSTHTHTHTPVLTG